MSKEGRGFFLFGALNGLIERARSSAEKESQRLFTVPEASVPADAPTAQQSAGRKRKSAPLVPSLSKTRHRPRPPRKQESLGAALHERRLHGRVSPPPPPPRASSVISERTHLAATVGTLALEGGALDEPCTAPVQHQAGVREWLSDHTMLSGTHAAGAGPFEGQLAGSELAVEATTPSTTSKRKWTVDRTPPLTPTRQQSQQRTPPDASAKKTRVAVGRREQRESAGSPPNSSIDLPALPRIHAASTRSSMTAVSAAVEMGISASTQTPPPPPDGRHGRGKRAMDSPEPLLAEPSSAVERARLEKVERELHRLKKIIASLLPEELNDDDLRSVYGDMDRPRHTSEDVITRLIKARFGTLMSPPLPPATTCPPGSSAAEDPQGGSCGPRAAIPVPPPLPPMSSSLLNAVNSLAAARGARERGTRPVRVGSVSSLLSSRHPGVSSSTVQRLRSELRPVPKPASSSKAAPPPPHKDPGVMTKLLEEMKHHKLRSVKKPEDMCSS
ncbi:hypothetical protein LPJ61_003941 [Coemansia biformis]|uniref:Uncharacterized protein n=1 Tax=Coemansia biformis TaxID=1286918 RepID=A0A9W8CVU0_9FUNG|nr:hypothetical protein LPJ61_003941 [Coemansia biformis]